MSDKYIDAIVSYLSAHNTTVESLLASEQGRYQLYEYVRNELALFGFFLAAEEADVPPTPQEDVEKDKKRFIDKAREFFGKHGKSIAEILLPKINEIVKGFLLPSA